jgi:UDP-N-acetyl-D-mannosaminuronate dehydrogenase
VRLPSFRCGWELMGGCRESPAITIVKQFRDENARISVFDPKVPHATVLRDLLNKTLEGDATRCEYLVPCPHCCN